MASVAGCPARIVVRVGQFVWQGRWHVSHSRDSEAQESGLPTFSETGHNPSWKVRVGVSRREIEALDATEKQGIWFDSEEEMDAFVQRHTASQETNDGGS